MTIIRKELPKVNRNTNIIEFDLTTGKVSCAIYNKKKTIAEGNLKSVFLELYADIPEFQEYLRIWNILDGTTSYATPLQKSFLKENPPDPEAYLDSLGILYDSLEGRDFRYGTIPNPLPKDLIEDIINL